MALQKDKKKAPSVKAPKGMRDILPADRLYWDHVSEIAEEMAQAYSFSRIETPVLEDANIFEKSLGETSDIVEKQMFSVKTRGGEILVLRPEGTAPIMRAYIEHGMSHLPQPVKLYYASPMFRHEQPQAGRFREFHQIGFEIIGGESDPIYDAQVILVMNRFFSGLKIKNIVTEINSLGCRVCRLNYRRKLIGYYKERKNKLCKNCERRLEINPLRLLDCKDEDCAILKRDAPVILDSLCKACSAHFKEVLEFIEELKIPYRLNHYLVRGLDYYNRTVFEIFSENPAKTERVDASNEDKKTVAPSPAPSNKLALASGGRYDFLGEMLGARPISAVGGASGVERIVELLKASGQVIKTPKKRKIFFVYIGETSKKKSLPLIDGLINSGFNVVEALGKESLKSQFRLADREKIEWALIFGQKEAFEETIILRDMKTGVQETIALKNLVVRLKKRFDEK